MATVRTRSSGGAVSSLKSSRVMKRLQQNLVEGSFYEAHQTYRALYQRLCAQGSEEQAINLLLEGASTLLKHSQWESGTDLGLLLVSHLKNRRSPITEDTLDMISQLFVLYKAPLLPPPPDHAHPTEGHHHHHHHLDHAHLYNDPREVFMRAALKWSSMVGGEDCKYGHPHLHKLLALSYWEVKQYARAREHFQYACEPESYAHMLVEVAVTHGKAKEADLFLTQAILQLLVLKNRRSAMGIFSTYTQTHPAFRNLEGPPYQDVPLLNFIWFLLLSTESGDSEVFMFLRRQYSNLLARDPCFDEYLDKVGVNFFGLRPPEEASATAGGGGLGGLMNLLGGGGGEGGSNNLLGSLLGGLTGQPPPPQHPLLLQTDASPAPPPVVLLKEVDLLD